MILFSGMFHRRTHDRTSSKMKIPRTYIAVLFTAGLLALPPGAAASDYFPVPDLLKTNVEFWIKIYTEVGLNEGLLHDRDYPLIIYDKVTVGSGTRRGETGEAAVKKEKIIAALRALRETPESQWTADQRRIRALFTAYANDSALADAESRLRFQLGQKQRFYEGLQRSGMYLDTIRVILAQYDVPAELAYLPHVESSFDADAYSKVGAAGLWQFMRATGKLYLTIDYLVDERRDPILATYAAAKLLSYNYRELQAWPLAITAYNHGLYGMKRAVENTGSRDIAVIIQKHQSRSFQFASKNFYSCFLAARQIASAPEKYFKTVSYMPRLVYNDVVLPRYVTADVISEYLNIPKTVLQRLNPALRPTVFQHHKQIPKGYVLRIPVTVPSTEALALFGTIPDSLKLDEASRPQYYRVESGDNLYLIASRLGVSAQELADENNITRMNRIYVGQVLNIPVKGAGPAATVAVASEPVPQDRETGEQTQETAAPPPVPPAEKPAAARAPSHKPVVASVSVEIDTIEEIAMVAADTIPSLSGAVKTGYSKFDLGIYNLETVLSPGGNTAEIRVSLDETISHIAEWSGAPLSRIKALSGMGKSSDIRLNQKLVIPIERPDALDRFAKSRLEYHLALEEDFYGTYKVVDVKAHAVRRGQNLWDICNEAGGIPMWLLKKHNRHISLEQLMPGSIVWLPVTEEKTEEDIAMEALGDGGLYPDLCQPVRATVGPARLIP